MAITGYGYPYGTYGLRHGEHRELGHGFDDGLGSGFDHGAVSPISTTASATA
jgi:hypothetical protein